jgi:hypothetical protein
VATILALSGCLQPAESHDPFPTGERVVPVRAANLTACIGAEGGILVPTATAAQHLPPDFQPLETAPGVVMLSIDAFRCGKVAVGGVDHGPASLVIVDLGGRSTSNAVPEGSYARILYSAISDSEPLVHAMNHTGFEFRDLTIRIELEVLPFAQDRLTVAIRYPGVDYAWEAFLSKPTISKQDDFRAFNSEQTSEYADHSRRFESTGASPTVIHVSGGSPAATLMPHSTTGQGLTSFLSDGSIRMVSPGATG